MRRSGRAQVMSREMIKKSNILVIVIVMYLYTSAHNKIPRGVHK